VDFFLAYTSILTLGGPVALWMERAVRVTLPLRFDESIYNYVRHLTCVCRPLSRTHAAHLPFLIIADFDVCVNMDTRLSVALFDNYSTTFNRDTLF
jgi:hypothetical protein